MKNDKLSTGTMQLLEGVFTVISFMTASDKEHLEDYKWVVRGGMGVCGDCKCAIIWVVVGLFSIVGKRWSFVVLGGYFSLVGRGWSFVVVWNCLCWYWGFLWCCGGIEVVFVDG